MKNPYKFIGLFQNWTSDVYITTIESPHLHAAHESIKESTKARAVIVFPIDNLKAFKKQVKEIKEAP